LRLALKQVFSFLLPLLLRSPSLYLTLSIESSHLFRTSPVIFPISVTQFHLNVSCKTASCLPHIFIFLGVLLYICGPDSSVGIATGYGLDGPEIESRWGRDFLRLSRPTLGPTQPPVQWVPGLSRE